MLTDIKLLAIDLDGTLVDSAPDLAHCLGVALELLGLRPPSEADTRTLIGEGIEKLVERALLRATDQSVSAETYIDALASFTQCYERNLFKRSQLYPHATETLDALRTQGIHLCCVTNKRYEFAKQILSLAGVGDRFELIVGGNSVTKKKPDPEGLELAASILGISASQAAIVGDSHHDYLAASAADFRFIWAAYGYCESINDSTKPIVARIARFSELTASR